MEFDARPGALAGIRHEMLATFVVHVSLLGPARNGNVSRLGVHFCVHPTVIQASTTGSSDGSFSGE